MNLERFFCVWVGLMIILFCRAVSAYGNGWMFRKQLEKQGFLNGFAVFEHGGYRADWLLMAPLTAYLASKYSVKYTSVWSWVILAAILVGFYFMGKLYNKMSLTASDGFSVDGRMTTVGWLHGMFALPVSWVLCLVYLSQTDPHVLESDLMMTSIVLSAFFPVGLMKFGGGWKWKKTDIAQAYISVLIVWVITITKLLLR